MGYYETESWEASPAAFEAEQEYGMPLGEMQEMEAAANLLEVQSEEELEEFLGDIVKGVGHFFKTGVGKALGGVLKNVAKQALPALGQSLGSLIPIPGVGGMIGSALGGMASSALGSEMEFEEAQFETARKLVQLAALAGQNAAAAPPNAPPQAVAHNAVVQAAQQLGVPVQPPAPQHAAYGNGHHPEAYGYDGATHPEHHHHRSGRWVRHGRVIVLLGA